jgi:hypothetical protein
MPLPISSNNVAPIMLSRSAWAPERQAQLQSAITASAAAIGERFDAANALPPIVARYGVTPPPPVPVPVPIPRPLPSGYVQQLMQLLWQLLSMLQGRWRWY